MKKATKKVIKIVPKVATHHKDKMVKAIKGY